MENYIKEKEIDFLNTEAGKYYAGSGLEQDAYDSLDKAGIEYAMINDNGEELLLKINNKLVGFRYSSPTPEWGEDGIGFFSAEYYQTEDDLSANEFTGSGGDNDQEIYDDEGYFESGILNCCTSEDIQKFIEKKNES